MTLRLYQGTRMVGQPVRRGKRRPSGYFAPASCLLARSGRRLVSDFNRLNQNGAPRLNRAAVARTPGISGHIGAPFFQLTASTSKEALVRIDRTSAPSFARCSTSALEPAAISLPNAASAADCWAASVTWAVIQALPASSVWMPSGFPSAVAAASVSALAAAPV